MKRPTGWSPLQSLLTVLLSAPICVQAVDNKLVEDFASANVINTAKSHHWLIENGLLQSQIATGRSGSFFTNAASATKLPDAAAAATQIIQQDLNGDGYPDLLLGYQDAGIQLLLNNTTNQPFDAVTPLNIAADQPIAALLAEDIDQDGDIDIIAFGQQGALTLFKNNGQQGNPFENSTPLAGPDSTQVHAAALVDLNQDGHLDLVVARNGINQYLYHSADNNDPFANSSWQNFGTEANSYDIAVADFNQDGLVDVVIGNAEQANQLFLNHGAGLNEAINIAAQLNKTRAIAIADINQDGLLDLIEGNYGQANYVYLNNSQETPFSAPVVQAIASSSANTLDIVALDINNDSAIDVMEFNDNQPSQYWLHSTQNEKAYTQVSPVALSYQSTPAIQAVAADFNRDGSVDLATILKDSGSQFLRNIAAIDPFSTAQPQVLLQNVNNAVSIISADFNLDGRDDILLSEADQSQLLLNNGDLTSPFSNVSPIVIATSGVTQVTYGDINRDGAPDLVFARNGINQRLLNSHSADPFTGQTLSDIGSDNGSTAAIVLADINQDSYLDLLTLNQDGNNYLYANQRNATIFDDTQRTTLQNSAFNSQAGLVYDFDHNGTLDVVVANSDNVTQIYLNQDPSALLAQTNPIALTEQSHQTVALGHYDYNLDGLDDIVEINQDQSYIITTNKSVLPRSADNLHPLSNANASLTNIATAKVINSARDNLLATNAQQQLVFIDAQLNSAVISDNLNSSQIAIHNLDHQSGLDVVFIRNGELVLLSNTQPKPVSSLQEQRLFQSTDAMSEEALANDKPSYYFTNQHLVADFNNDGKDDILASSNRVGLYLYHSFSADGASFIHDTIYPASNSFNDDYYPVAGDLDNDGDMDILLLQENHSDAILLYNNGSATPFKDVSPVAMPLSVENAKIGYIDQVALTDLNNDGWLDLVVGSGDYASYFLHQQNAIPYNSQQMATIEAWSLNRIFNADFNRDSRTDWLLNSAVAAWSNTSVLLNAGTDPLFDGTTELLLQDAQTQTALEGLEDLQDIVDLNNDGYLDILSYALGDSNASVFLGSDSNSYTEVDLASALNLSSLDGSIVGHGDINQDGWLDLFVAYNNESELYVLLNTQQNNAWFSSDNRIWLQTFTASSEKFERVPLLADVNGDGMQELLTRSSRYLPQDNTKNDDQNVIALGFIQTLPSTAELSSYVTSQPMSLTSPTQRLTLVPQYSDDHHCATCSIHYWLSNNGGAQFYQVQPNIPFIFPSEGSDVVWTLSVDSLSAADHFQLEQLTISSNIAPQITGQNDLSVAEDTTLTLSLADLQIVDQDNTTDQLTLTLTADDSGDYSIDGLDVTPAANFHGTITLQAVVSDAESSSAPFNIDIQVESVQDAPSINGFKSSEPFIAFEEEAVLITLADLVITDPDNLMANQSFSLIMDNSGNTLASATSQGSSLLVTPRNGVADQINLPVKLISADNNINSAVALLPINIQRSNDTPVIQGLARFLSTNEETELALQVSDLLIIDDDASFNLTVLPGSNYSVKDDKLTLLPNENFSGNLSVNVQVADSEGANSAIAQIIVEVKNVNDAPTLTAQANAIEIDEDSNISIGLSDLVYQDPDSNDALRIRIIDKADNQFSYATDPSDSSRWLITPQANLTGEFTVTVKLQDQAGADSQEVSIIINVLAQNDAPFVAGAKEIIRLEEDLSGAITLDMLNIIDPDSDASSLTLTVKEGEHYTLENGNVIKPDTNYVGSLSVPVIVSDGQASSAETIITVLVGDTIDSPVVVGQQYVSINEQGALTLSLDMLTIEGGDSSNYSLVIEQNESLYSIDYASNTVHFKSGVVGYIPVSLLIVTGGEPVRYSYNVLVNNVNDAPVVLQQKVSYNTEENTPVFFKLSDFDVQDIDSANSDLTLIIQDGEHYTHAIKGSNIVVTPEPGYVGQLTVYITVSDNTGASSEPFAAKVMVRGRGGDSGGGAMPPALLLLAAGLLLWRRQRR